MAKSKNEDVRVVEKPANSWTIKEYDELNTYFHKFAEGFYRFIWLTARAGVGKSYGIEQAMKKRGVGYIRGGHITPMHFYIKLYEHRNDLIIIDDSEHLFANHVSRRHLSAVCDTLPEKHVSWESKTGALHTEHGEEVPKHFTSTSQVCVIANFGTHEPAIQSRGQFLFFDPDNLEVHREIAKWYTNQEVHDWIGQHMHEFKLLSFRDYIKINEDFAADCNWQRKFSGLHGRDADEIIIQQLELDPAFTSVKARRKRFCELTGKHENTYTNKKRELVKANRLKPESAVERIILPYAKKQCDSAPKPAEPVKRESDFPNRVAFTQTINGKCGNGQAKKPVLLGDDLTFEHLPIADEDE